MDGRGEEELRENGRGGGEEREDEDGRDDRWERKPFLNVLGPLWAECPPQRPSWDEDPRNQELNGGGVSAKVSRANLHPDLQTLARRLQSATPSRPIGRAGSPVHCNHPQ